MESGQDAGTAADRPPKFLLFLALIVAASFAIRVAAWSHWRTGAIESEGAEYARLAENLRNGIGFVGLVTPGPQLNFNPLFPLLIAGGSFLTHGDFELAGRLVGLIMGSLLPLPVFGTASRLFDRRVGLIAALLVLLHPLLVHLSFTVFSEGPYLTLFLFAVYLSVRALEQPSLRNWLLVGAAFAFAWLVRAEALLGFAVAMMFALLVAPGDLLTRCKRTLAAVAAFLLLISPEAIFVYRATGKLKLEGKSTIFLYDAQRILAAEHHPGQEYTSPGGHHEIPTPEPNVESALRWEEKWAFFGIDSHLKGMGFALRPHVEILREARMNPGDLPRIIAAGMRQNLPILFQRLSSDWLGAPLLPALAFLGVFRRSWQAKQARVRWFVLLIMAAPMVATFTSLRTEQRYYFVFIPLLSIFAANGLVGVGLWFKASAAVLRWPLLARPLSGVLVSGAVGLAMLLAAVSGRGNVYNFAESAPSTQVDKEIGHWLGQRQNYPIKVMDLSIPLAYHAGAQLFSYFPYCSNDSALQYADAAQVDYIVLRREAHFTRYYQDWVERGISDSRAELLQLPAIPGAGKFIVYRWHRIDSPGNSHNNAGAH